MFSRLFKTPKSSLQLFRKNQAAMLPNDAESPQVPSETFSSLPIIRKVGLEPACGTGNFLDEVLRRKLAVCQKRYGKSAADYEKMSFLACTTLYGVDIMADNVARCRERLFETWEGSFNPTFHVREQNPSGCWGFAHRSSLHSRFGRVGSFA